MRIAALIAEHLEAAGDLHGAYDWQMRAAIVGEEAATSLRRGSAGSGPERSPTHGPPRTRTAQRCASPLAPCCARPPMERVHTTHGARFDELRQLCGGDGDKPSLAIAMAGLVMDHAYQGQIRQASGLASEAMALIESLADATLTVGLSFPAIYAKIESGEYSDVLRWSQRMVDLAGGDPFKGNFIFGSPLALAFTSRAMARYCLGRADWQDDLRHGLAMAHSADPLTYAAVVAWVYFPAISERRAVRRRSRGARDRGCAADCRTIGQRHGARRSPGSLSGRSRWCTVKRLRNVTADRRSWPRSATCSKSSDTTWVIARSSTRFWHGKWLGVENTMRRFR